LNSAFGWNLATLQQREIEQVVGSNESLEKEDNELRREENKDVDTRTDIRMKVNPKAAMSTSCTFENFQTKF
jgi:hypothetical protein